MKEILQDPFIIFGLVLIVIMMFCYWVAYMNGLFGSHKDKSDKKSSGHHAHHGNK